MPRFRKKPVEIEAVRLGWDTWGDVCALFGQHEGLPRGTRGVYVHKKTGAVYTEAIEGQDAYDIGMEIVTLEGVMVAAAGDWIIKGVKNEFYPCKDAIFRASYEPVDEG